MLECIIIYGYDYYDSSLIKSWNQEFQNSIFHFQEFILKHQEFYTTKENWNIENATKIFNNSVFLPKTQTIVSTACY